MKTPDERRALKDRMPKASLSCKHTSICKVLPDRFQLLNEMRQGSVVAEIGVAFGEFSTSILETCQPTELHLIDAWSTDRYRAGQEDVRQKFAHEIEQNQVKIHQGISTEVLPLFDTGFFDWVYIDTNHSFETTYQELELCRDRVADTGRICGHDYCTGNVIKPVPYGVVEAVNLFCLEHDWQFEYLTLESHGHFSFCLKRI